MIRFFGRPGNSLFANWFVLPKTARVLCKSAKALAKGRAVGETPAARPFCFAERPTATHKGGGAPSCYLIIIDRLYCYRYPAFAPVCLTASGGAAASTSRQPRVFTGNGSAPAAAAWTTAGASPTAAPRRPTRLRGGAVLCAGSGCLGHAAGAPA